MSFNYRFFVMLAVALCFTCRMEAQVTTGIPPFGSYGGGPETINLANLNAHWTIPVFQRAGRGGDSLNYNLTYDNSIWNPVTSGSTQTWTPVANWGWTSSTAATTGHIGYYSYYTGDCPYNNGKLGVGYNGRIYYYTNWVFYDALGTIHTFSGSTQVYYSYAQSCSAPPPTSFTATANDGSGYTLQATGASGVVYNSKGTQIGPPINAFAGPGTLTDRNGNIISIDNSGNITDTLGTVALVVAGSGTPTSPITFTYTAPNGQPVAYTANYTNYTVATNFGISGITEYKSSAAVPLITSIVLPDGSQYTFTYESTPSTPSSGACTAYSGTTCTTGRVASVTLPTGGTISYTYTGGYNGIFSDGSTATLTRTTPDPSGQWSYAQVKNTAPASTTTVTDPLGDVTTINFQGIYETQRVVNQGASSVLLTRSTCYNGSTIPCTGTAITLPITGLSVSTLLPGSNSLTDQHNYTYDGYGNLLQQQDYDYGSGAKGSLLDTTTISYASLGNITAFRQQVTVTNGAGTTVSQTNYNYDQTAVQTSSNTPQHTSVSGSRGNLTSVNYYTAGSTYLTQTTTYWDTGMINTSTDVNGGVTTYGYSSETSTCGNSFPTGVTEAITTLTQSYTWNCTGGVQLTSQDENNQITTTIYNDLYYWRPASITDATGAKTNFCYGLVSTAGTCTANSTQVESYLTPFTSNSTTVNVDSLTTLDGLGRTILQQKRQGALPTGTFDTIETDYDTLGRVKKQSTPFSSNAGTINSSAYGTTILYDALNRPSSITDSGGGSVSINYPQNDAYISVAAPSGENNKRRQLEYNSLGQLTSVCEVTSMTGSGTCGQNASYTGYWTKYINNALGQITGVTQNAQSSSTQTRTYVYDLMGRLTSETNPESGTTTYSYDTVPSSCYNYGDNQSGNLTEKTDANGNAVCPHFDVLHRLHDVASSGPNSGYCKRYRYDFTSNGWAGTPPSGITVSNIEARLMEAATDNCTGTTLTDEWFSYTARGQMSNSYQSTPHSSGYYNTTATYWPNGAPDQLSGVPGLTAITYSLDGEGRTYTVSAASGQNPVTGTTYNPASEVTNLTLGSGDSDAFAYDNMDRMNQYQFAVGGQSMTGNPTWNGNGTLGSLAITDPFNSGDNQTCSYSHDDLVRIASANCTSNPAWAQTFTYDAFGNIDKSGNSSFQPTYSATTNRMTSLPGCTPTYDADGDVTNDCLNTYTWDAYGRPASIDGETHTTDALGRFVEFENTYQFIYAPTGTRLAFMNGQTFVRAFVPLPGNAQAVYDASVSNGLYFYRHADWLGSSRLTSSPQRTTQSTTAYAPFGENYVTTGSGDIAFTGLTPIQGLYNYSFREYDQTRGRWPSPDPAGLAAVDPTIPQSWNRYAYVTNSPLMYTDPTGMNKCWQPGMQQAYSCSGGGYVDSGISGWFWIPGDQITELTIDPNEIDIYVSPADPGFYIYLGGGGPAGGSSYAGTFVKTFINGVLHGDRQPGESFAACVSQNASQTTFGATDKVSAGAVAAVTAVGATVGAFSQVPSPWANSANTIVNVVGEMTGQTPNPVNLTLAGTIGGFIARSLGGGFGATRLAIGAASGLSAGAAYGTTALVGGVIGLYAGSAINCR
jgi:RHS repeat-associated protein